jgi:hypothetical protein
MVDSAPKIAELAVDLHKHLVQVPAPLRIAAHVRDASLTNLGGEHRAKPVPPEPDGLVADVDPALGQEIFDVAQRQRISHVHHHDQTDDLRRAVEISERVAHGLKLPRRDALRALCLTTPARRFEPTDDIILSRIKGRTDSEQLPTVIRVIGDVATGDFDGFEALIAGEEQTSDEAFTIRAFDLSNAGSHSILGKKLNLIELLPSGLKNVSAAISMGNFERVANAPAQEIARARDDAKNSVAIALNLYEANRWIYGDGAFGLRLAAWIARKAPDVLVDTTTLLMFRLRAVPGAILPSDKIAEMAENARKVRLYSERLEWHWHNHPSFSKILHPKRIKSAFADEIALKRWQSELNTIILQATAKPPKGSSDDGQDVGKGH